jgi:hypothetical protein
MTISSEISARIEPNREGGRRPHKEAGGQGLPKATAFASRRRAAALIAR